MKIVYNAPNRAHHYGYARELQQAGMLQTLVSGFPRISPRAPIPEIGTALKRADQVQTLFIASHKLGLPEGITAELCFWAKLQLDHASRRPLQDADMFLFYNGCGLNSARWFRQRGGITVVEAVNSHVRVQEQLMREEHQQLGLPWQPFHPRETQRRVAEVEEADYVLLPSTFVARSFVAQGIPARRLLQVPYPMQSIAGTPVPESRRAEDGGPFRVLYVGSISVRKGLRYLIEAFRQLKHPQKELWIVGPTANPSGIEGLSMPAEVKFWGVLKGNDLQSVYARASVFCLPSIEDGFGLVLNEALAHGLPVIATENTGIEDLLADGKGGAVVPIRDAPAIAACLNRLADDPQFLAIKREEALQTAARVRDPGRKIPRLSATLMQAFHQHRASANEPD
jgi:glycosyltransferase involved in cell wall biosynthesis